MRRNIDDLNATEIATLRAGIAAMKARPISDPTSWEYQAAIHGHSSGASQPAWNSCQHGSFFFLSWHRMYLHFFERILRDASGDPNFALPYWDYTDLTNPNARQLPDEFLTPADASTNPLFTSNRRAVINAGGSIAASAVSFADAYDLTVFSSTNGASTFGGQEVGAPIHAGFPHSEFESTPHDDVHVQVGGGMGSFEEAALDPIFWLHHANIDRLWEGWLQGPGRSNPSSGLWLTQMFTFFDENGNQVPMSGADIVNTAQDLSYTYDALPPAPQSEETVVVVEEQELVVIGDTTNVEFQEDGSFTIIVIEEESEESGTYELTLADVEVEALPGGHYEVYVNVPEGVTPNYDSRYYVGNLSFFGLKPRDQVEPGSEGRSSIHQYDITDLVADLRATNEWTGEAEVTFVLAAPEPPPGFAEPEDEPPAIYIGRISISRG
ncbi:MAG: tyrosinase family protein [Gemmatimonadetes bacterium]|nr:tyrosinase family protein [Gemmatimonadota bacterium]